MRKADTLLLALGCGFAALAATFIDARLQAGDASARIEDNRRLVRELQLTDLCLFTEARYTRHPSQADLHSPFQDHPMALEHFPSGSLIPPPRTLTHGLVR
ncbi:MAG TPA: hypothetical protein VFP70_10485 [Burkholderiales bacterium]|nr:hypothetical protein [Burkholderiales bacterium]